MTTTRNPEGDRLVAIDAEIARHRAACGCELGSIFALAAVLGLSLYAGSGHVDWSWPGTLARGLAWVVGLSVVGKLLGLAYAQAHLVRLRAERSRLTDRPSTPVHHLARK